MVRDDSEKMENLKAEYNKLEGIGQIRNGMAKNQYMLKCQYAISVMEAKLKIINEQMTMKHGREIMRSITSRIKTPESIYAKLWRKKCNTDFATANERLNDIIGVRVISLFLDDLYEIAEILKKQQDVRVIKVKDYIASPKKNGYMSLHLILEIPIYFEEYMEKKRVEVQLRTIAMDCWSVLDYQLCYKRKNMEEAQEVMEKLKKHSDTIAIMDREMVFIRNEIEKI